MAKDIPKGWEKSHYQDHTYPMGGEFLREQCGGCGKNGSCEIEGYLRSAMGNNYPFGHESVVVVNNIHSIFEKKMICLEHEPLQQNLPLEDMAES